MVSNQISENPAAAKVNAGLENNFAGATKPK
jgi:hypothetical protein